MYTRRQPTRGRKKKNCQQHATHTTRHKLTLTAELHYNGAAPGRSTWQALRGEPLPAYLQYRAWSLQALEPPTRWALFFHATWKDALMPGLDLSSLWHLDRVDASRRHAAS